MKAKKKHSFVCWSAAQCAHDVILKTKQGRFEVFLSLFVKRSTSPWLSIQKKYRITIEEVGK
jgi:hypothetical protein